MIYHEQVIDALRELADFEYQARVWSGSSESEMSSFVECVALLFDDSGLSMALDKGHAFGGRVDHDLRAFQNLVKTIDGGQSFDQLMADPQLAECRRTAAELLRLISEQQRAFETQNLGPQRS